MIGILGGMGPQAGLDLAAKVISQTDASRDQEHLPMVLVSEPRIPDRTTFIKDPSAPSPSSAMASALLRLQSAGATIAGIACNTAHSPVILEPALAEFTRRGGTIPVLHLIGEAVASIRRNHPDTDRVALLATSGTLGSRLYHDVMEKAGLEPIVHDDLDRMTDAITHPEWGIKGKHAGVTAEAREDILAGARELHERGANVIILGCTELPLAVPEAKVDNMVFIDPALALARALISAFEPNALRPRTHG